MSEIAERLHDLVKQATTERSHFYVKKTAKEAASHIKAQDARIERLEKALNNINQRRYANRRTVHAENAFEEFGRQNREIVEIFDEARAALENKP